MGTARHARRALIAAAAALLCFVAVFAAAGNSVRAVVSGAFTKSEEIRAAQASLAQAVTLQLDEETGVRGSLATGQVSFLEPYHLGRTQLPVALAALQERVGVLGLPEASRHARTLAALNREWTAAVARPLLTLPPSNGLREQRRGKTLVDRFRAEAASLDAILNRRRIAVNDAMQAAIWRVGTYVLVSVLVIAGLALGLVALQLRFLDRLERERARADEERLRASRMQAAYETEKRIADKLQGALFQRPLPATSGLELSATYAPAEEETRVGGDWYDVLELPGDRIFFAIGDVAGHGIDAAVAMNRARHALVSAAMRAGESRGVLTHANEELCRDGTVMVTAIAGFANYRNVNSIWRSPVIPHRCFSSPADRRGCSRAAVCRWVFRAPIRTRRSTFKPYRDRRWFSIPTERSNTHAIRSWASVSSSMPPSVPSETGAMRERSTTRFWAAAG